MAAEGSDEMPLIFTTQTSATITDLDIDELNLDDPTVTNIGSNITTGSMDSRTVSSFGRMQITSGVPTSPSRLDIQSTVASTLDPGGMFTTVPSVVLRSSSVGSVVPYDRSSGITPPYNSSALCMRIVHCWFM